MQPPAVNSEDEGVENDSETEDVFEEPVPPCRFKLKRRFSLAALIPDWPELENIEKPEFRLKEYEVKWLVDTIGLYCGTAIVGIASTRTTILVDLSTCRSSLVDLTPQKICQIYMVVDTKKWENLKLGAMP